MGDFAQAQDYSRVVINSHSMESVGVEAINATGVGVASAVWPSANQAIYVPFVVGFPITAVKMFTSNGASAAGNTDIGIYDRTQNRLVSMGPTAQSGTSAIQSFDITDTLLLPGVYYMALSSSSTSATFLRSSIAVATLRAMGVLSQASAGTLPSPATLAAASSSYLPLFGLTARTVV